jgi:ABC-type transporter Mla MlaB component
MIKSIRKNNVLYLSFFPDTTICSVQEDTEKLLEIISSLDGIDNIQVNLKNIDNIDTAYIQLIYSLFLTAKKEYIEINMRHKSEIFNNFTELYGLEEV